MLALPKILLLLAENAARKRCLTATGYADIGVQSEIQVSKELRNPCFNDAYRSLSEQIYGLYIDATTTVGDLVVQNDVIQSQSKRDIWC